MGGFFGRICVMNCCDCGQAFLKRQRRGARDASAEGNFKATNRLGARLNILVFIL